LTFWINFSPVNKKGWFKLQTTPQANNGWIHVAPDSRWQDQKRKKKRLDRPCSNFKATLHSSGLSRIKFRIKKKAQEGRGCSQNKVAICCSRNVHYPSTLPFLSITRGVSYFAIAIYITKYLKAKEELWTLKYFTMQKYNLQNLL
jgi:hypothetical protein